MKSLLSAMTLSLGLMVATTAQASLINRGGGLIYDDDLDITWLANANVDNATWPGGVMTWLGAMIWVSDFSYYDSVRNVTYTDWRLPTTLQPDANCSFQGVSGGSSGYNCIGSEMGHLFYGELSGTAGASILSSANPDLALFANVQPSWYWSSTEYVPNNGDVWSFNFSLGYQSATSGGGYAWAVRDGDVAAVPPPPAAWLFGSGLIGLAAVTRRRRLLRVVI